LPPFPLKYRPERFEDRASFSYEENMENTLALRISRDDLDLLVHGLEYYLSALIHADNTSSTALGKDVLLLLKYLVAQRHTGTFPENLGT
jgi:hypothetical protein